MSALKVLHYVVLLLCISQIYARTGFEKLTDLDYRGTTYYTIRNLSLYECQGWCREEPDCAAASFSFVVNPLAPIQETVCLLQNDTQANNPTSNPQKSISTYYMVKLNIRSENVCTRPWTFERVPNKILSGLDNALIFTATKESCLASCLNERRFVCRSVEYNYITTKCHLSEHDRRSVDEFVELIDAQGVDYFENLCLKSNEACQHQRQFDVPQIGVAEDRIAQHVDIHFYVDKELLATTSEACARACKVENEFLCRSFLYKENSVGSEYNCQLFHLDHFTLPDGPSTFLSTDRPLLDDGEPIGKFAENICMDDDVPNIPSTEEPIKPPSPRPSPNPTRPTRPGSASTARPGSIPATKPEISKPTTVPTDRPGIGITSPSNPNQPDINCDRTGTCYNVNVNCRDTKIEVSVNTNRPFNGRVYALGRSETCNIVVQNSDKFRLDLSMFGSDCNTQSMNGMFSNTIVLQHHSVVMTKGDKIYKIKCTYDTSPKNVTFGMMPIRDPDMISITSAPAAPPPRIRILDPASGSDVETVRIGDRLIFRIEIPGNTPYGIFARSCMAMAKDSRSTFQIIDDDGCPVDPSIFPRFVPEGTALQSTYEAFRFTESYGVIFQCNVRYCLGPCEPASCAWGRDKIESWGRRKRNVDEAVESIDKSDTHVMQEILVLDINEDGNKVSKQVSVAVSPDQFSNNSTYTVHEETVTIYNNTCPTKNSVLALAVTCALLLLIYLCTVFYFLMRRWMGPGKIV